MNFLGLFWCNIQGEICFQILQILWVAKTNKQQQPKFGVFVGGEWSGFGILYCVLGQDILPSHCLSLPKDSPIERGDFWLGSEIHVCSFSLVITVFRW